MQIVINKTPRELPDGATLADALALIEARPPFAAAVNLCFVPKTRYADTPLTSGDDVEVITPVTGG